MLQQTSKVLRLLMSAELFVFFVSKTPMIEKAMYSHIHTKQIQISRLPEKMLKDIGKRSQESWTYRRRQLRVHGHDQPEAACGQLSG